MGLEERATTKPAGRQEVRVAAVGGAIPAACMFVLAVLIATDGSNDRHRDMTNLVAGVARGVPVAAVTWVIATAALVAVAYLLHCAQRIADLLAHGRA